MAKRVDIAARLEALGVDPLDGMVRIAAAAERNNNLALAAKIHSDLLEYCAPKLKTMEFSIEPETMQFLDRQQRIARIQQLLKQTRVPLTADMIEGEYTELLHVPDQA